MNREHLTPKSIVDKNGKHTTVYTKAAHGTAAGTPLPPPAALTGNAMAKQIDEVVTHIAEMMDFDEPDQYDNTRMLVESYPADLINELHTKSKEGELGFILSSLVWSGDTADKVRDGLCFVPGMRTDSSDLAYHLLRSIHCYPQLPKREHYYDADEKTQTQLRALITVTETLIHEEYDNDTKGLGLGYVYNEEGFQTEFLEEPTLVDLVMEYPDRADEIAALILERKADQASIIADIVRSSIPALAEGAL